MNCPISESNIPSAAFSTNAPSTRMTQRGFHLPHHPNRSTADGSIALPEQSKGHKSTVPGQPSSVRVNLSPAQGLASPYALSLAGGSRGFGCLKNHWWFFPLLPTRKSKHPALLSSTAHPSSTLLSQEAPKLSLLSGFSQTHSTKLNRAFQPHYQEADIKFSKYPSF